MAKAQDFHAMFALSPATGCVLASNEIMEFGFRNIGTTVTTSISVSYQINGGAPVTEVVNNTFLSGAVVVYSFSTLADFSAFGTYTITFYTDFISDSNPNNDTIKATIVNYAPTVGGNSSGSTTVCSSGNAGVISLSGNLGAVVKWEESTDQFIWSNITNTTAVQSYSNLATTTYYKAIVQNGACSMQSSTITTITVDQAPVGGALSGSSAFCYLPNAGVINLSGHSGTILSWEFSQDNGSSWTTIANTTTTQTYSALNQTTLYKARLGSGVCSVASSLMSTITVHPLTVGGSVANETACIAGNSDAMNLIGNTGAVQFWEISTNGGTSWTSTASTSVNLPYVNVTQETMYRANVKSGTCIATYSTPGTLSIDALPTAGSISSTSTKVCSNLNSGEILLSGNTGTVQKWESSINNVTFTAIPNTLPSLTFTNIPSTTYYRAVIANGACPTTYTNSLEIKADVESKSGKITGEAIICPIFNEGRMALINYVGDIVSWESSANNITFIEIVNTTNFIEYKNIKNTSYYKANVKSGVCDVATTSIFTLSTTGGPTIVLTNDTTIELGDEAPLLALGGAIYKWNFDETLSDSTIYNPIAFPKKTTTYYLTVEDEKKCENKDSVIVTVEKNYKFKIANLFTPNGDGYNDFWIIKNIDNYPNNEVYIHNRNGQEIFHTTSYQNNWDGTINGKKLPDGAYYYTLKFNDSDKLFRGSITILTGE